MINPLKGWKRAIIPVVALAVSSGCGDRSDVSQEVASGLENSVKDSAPVEDVAKKKVETVIRNEYFEAVKDYYLDAMDEGPDKRIVMDENLGYLERLREGSKISNAEFSRLSKFHENLQRRNERIKDFEFIDGPKDVLRCLEDLDKKSLISHELYSDAKDFLDFAVRVLMEDEDGHDRSLEFMRPYFETDTVFRGNSQEEIFSEFFSKGVEEGEFCACDREFWKKSLVRFAGTGERAFYAWKSEVLSKDFKTYSVEHYPGRRFLMGIMPEREENELAYSFSNEPNLEKYVSEKVENSN